MPRAMEAMAVETKRDPEFDAQRARQRALIEEVRRRHPSAAVSLGEHVELADGGRRSIPVVIVEFEDGRSITFFAKRPKHLG